MGAAPPWDEGPFGEQARAVFAPHVDDLAARLEAFDQAARSAPTRVVVTHGEPHDANVMTVRDGLAMIDWDTVGLAAPERDLWLLGLDEEAAHRYAEATGHRPDVTTMALYRERWDLDDLAHSVQLFRGAHGNDPETRRWLGGLPGLLSARPGDPPAPGLFRRSLGRAAR